MTKNLILGAPGTGKTTTLLSIIKDKLKSGVLIERIGLFTFSKAAAEEARKRLAHHRQPKMFRTLHSLAFNLLGLKKDSVMQPKDYAIIAKSIGMPPPSLKNADEMEVMTITDTVKYIEEQTRLRNVDVSELECDPFEPEALEQWKDKLIEYKRINVKVDYIDMLIKGAELPADAYPAFDSLFIDEAQDLNHLQWTMVEKLIHNSNHVYIAGDDDQCIYNFNGADIKTFLSLNKEGSYAVTTLDKSYRVCEDIWQFSQDVINKVDDRYEKDVSSNGKEGDIIPLTSNDDLYHWFDKFKDKDVMVLARTKFQVNKLKKFLPTAEEVEAKSLECMTYHQAKGLEADVVVCDLKLSPRVRKFFNFANESRLFYVGFTRAKELLIIINRDNGFEIVSERNVH